MYPDDFIEDVAVAVATLVGQHVKDRVNQVIGMPVSPRSLDMLKSCLMTSLRELELHREWIPDVRDLGHGQIQLSITYARPEKES